VSEHVILFLERPVIIKHKALGVLRRNKKRLFLSVSTRKIYYLRRCNVHLNVTCEYTYNPPFNLIVACYLVFTFRPISKQGDVWDTANPIWLSWLDEAWVARTNKGVFEKTLSAIPKKERSGGHAWLGCVFNNNTGRYLGRSRIVFRQKFKRKQGEFRRVLRSNKSCIYEVINIACRWLRE
jgi:hypothetical protein